MARKLEETEADMSFTIVEFLEGCVGSFRDLVIKELEQDPEDERFFSLEITSPEHTEFSDKEDSVFVAVSWFPDVRILNIAMWQPISTWGMESDEEALSFANSLNAGADSATFLAVITADMLNDPDEEDEPVSLFRIHASLKVPKDVGEEYPVFFREAFLETLYDLLAETAKYSDDAVNFTRVEMEEKAPRQLN